MGPLHLCTRSGAEGSLTVVFAKPAAAAAFRRTQTVTAIGWRKTKCRCEDYQKRDMRPATARICMRTGNISP